MRLLFVATTFAFCALVASCQKAQSPEIGVCSEEQLLAHIADRGDLAANRRAPVLLPVITYPFGTKIERDWGFDLKMRVDATGHVVCYSNLDRFDRPYEFSPTQRAMIQSLKDWRYDPFEEDRQAVAAIVTEHIAEVEAVERHIPLPEVPLDQVEIVLERGQCLGGCATYRVEIHGDGRLIYNGESNVDVLGRHQYSVPVEDVRRLVESLRSKDIWSLRPSYRGRWTDFPAYKLKLSFGGQTKELDDYIGRLKGMPASVSEFEDEVDEVTRSAIQVSRPASSQK